MDEIELLNQSNILEQVESSDLRRFAAYFELMMEKIHKSSIKEGNWEKRNLAEKLLFLHHNISNIVMAIKSGNPKVGSFSMCELELADLVVRIMDLSQEYDLHLADAIVHRCDEQ